MMKIIYTIILFIIGSVLISCDDTNIDLESENIPDKDVSFSKHILPVFFAKCTSSGCHNESSAAGNLILTNYYDVTKPGIVVKGAPESSKLVLVLKGQFGYLMPPLGSGITPFNTKQLNGLVTWIAEGAKDN